MIDMFGMFLTKLLLFLRYRVKFSGVEKVKSRGEKGILFLANHPAFIDPVILFSHLRSWFSLEAFGDEQQVNRPVIGFFARRWGVKTSPVVSTHGAVAKEKIKEKMEEIADDLNAGRNVILWPSGQLARSKYEKLGANSSVETILNRAPDTRVVLVKSSGIWGSEFSWGQGSEPKVGQTLQKAVWRLLVSGIFFAPRRHVDIELFEPDDLPREGSRSELNEYIENYYNDNPQPNTYVPYTPWEKLRGGRVHTIPDPDFSHQNQNTAEVPEKTANEVREYLSEMTGVEEIRPEQDLAADLGMDSLSRVDVGIWVSEQFGYMQPDAGSLRSVADVMAAAAGNFAATEDVNIKPAPKKWFRQQKQGVLKIAEGHTIAEVFFNCFCRNRAAASISDERSGMLSRGKTMRGVLALGSFFRGIKSEYAAIMLPASVAADLAFMAVLTANKKAVMLNWTVGTRAMRIGLEKLGVQKVITSRALVERLKSQGTDLGDIEEAFIYLEDVRKDMPTGTKLLALARSLVAPRFLMPKITASADDTAVVLFTSGSESEPKAVPLTHTNLLTNVREGLGAISASNNDKLMGFLPPFHSFGLTVTVLIPLLAGARSVYHANPVEANVIAKLIKEYKLTVVPGTPSFVSGIMQVSEQRENFGKLESVKICFTGAEKCSRQVYELLEKQCPEAVVLEGYGVTECSPVITLNDRDKPVKFSIGKILPSYEYLLIDPETKEPQPRHGEGLLAVRGPCVFNGYTGYKGKSPFVEYDGKQWYDTGDVVRVDEDDVFYFKARLKRFVKLGGEMISLPAIESVLTEALAPDDAEGPTIAVESAPNTDPPELTVFTTLDIKRDQCNQAIKDAGLSGLHNIRRLVKLEELPQLGTGKIDYKKLRTGDFGESS